MSATVTEGKPFLAPGMCFLCEQSNPVRHVDTFRDFEGIVRERLDGRKYVCEQCLAEYGEAIGMLSEKKADKLREDLLNAKNEVAKLTERVAELEPYEAVIKAATAKPAAKPKAKAAA